MNTSARLGGEAGSDFVRPRNSSGHASVAAEWVTSRDRRTEAVRCGLHYTTLRSSSAYYHPVLRECAKKCDLIGEIVRKQYTTSWKKRIQPFALLQIIHSILPKHTQKCVFENLVDLRPRDSSRPCWIDIP